MEKYRCDIIVVTWNKLDYIKECAQSILKHTDVRSRLIIVDNASAEDTREYLRGLKGSDKVDIKLIFNTENLGPGKARNIALKDISADYACFVDSDVVVAPGWLSNMISLADANSDIGMLNPSSNNFNQVPSQGVSLDEYARSLAHFKDSYIEVGHCISFCMLIKAEAVRKIGLIDEEYILALYEDTDYSMKASSAGYRCAIARGSYVWHYGHGSTGRVKKINAIAEKNKARFYKKWGRPLRIAWFSAVRVESAEFKEALASSVKLARDGNFIYMFAIEATPFSREEIFKRSNLAEHANVHLKFYQGKGFNWFCLWRVLIKRKKRYEIAIADYNIASLIRRFSFIHKVEAINRNNLEFMPGIVHKKKFDGVG